MTDRASFLLRETRPPAWLGIVAAVASVAFITALVYPLREIAPAVSVGVLYMLAVLLVSIFWGAWLGILTSLGGALAFNFFHIPPDRPLHHLRGRELDRPRDLLRRRPGCQLAGRVGAGPGGRGYGERPGGPGSPRSPSRGESGAGRARGRGDRGEGTAPQRRAEDGAAALGLSRPALAPDGDRRRRRVDRLPDAQRRRAGASWPRRSSIEARRLSRLVDKLLDLSRLEAGAAEPRRDWCSIEEIARRRRRAGVGPRQLHVSVDPSFR